MMNEKSKKIIQEEMLNLPEEAQEAINAFSWEKISQEIGKKYLLDDGEIETLQLETASFLLGFVDEDTYPRNIEDEVGTSKDEANKISEEIFQKIFTPINNIFLENIKKSGKHENANAEQNLDFILSGGDYSAFVAPARADIPPPPSGEVGRGFLNSPHPNPLLNKERGNTPKKMEDLKSKFTI